MADLSDVTTYLESAAAIAVYPNGTSQPSIVSPMDVRIFEGWPLPDQLDRDMSGTMLSGNPPIVVPRPNGPAAEVSVFPMAGMNSTPYQILDETYVITPAVIGLVVTLVNNVITVTGTPTTGEYVTVVIDHTFAYSRSGANAAAIIAALAADIVANYTGVSSTSSTLTIPGTFTIVVRQGAVGVLGRVTHRQKQSIMITIWAPNHRARATLAAAIDNAIKQKITVKLPDTSMMVVCYNRTNTSDDRQTSTIYRRDLIYDAEYATVQQFPGYIITTVNTSVANYNNSAIVPAIT